MKTNSKVVRQQIRNHIWECVFDYESNQFSSFGDAAKHLWSEFIRVANHPYNLKRIPNEQDRFSDYLSGLPFNFYFYHIEIESYLNSLGINPSGKVWDSEKSYKLYHYLIYSETKKAIC